MYVCISISHTHTHTLTHSRTYTDNCLQFHLGSSVTPLFTVASIMFGTHCLDKTGERVEKKMVGLIVSEILLLNFALGWTIFFCGSSLKRANSLWSSWRDLLTDHTLIVMLGEYWKKRNPHFNKHFFPPQVTKTTSGPQQRVQMSTCSSNFLLNWYCSLCSGCSSICGIVTCYASVIMQKYSYYW